MYDIIVIGAGVTGSAVARELSRYKYNVLVLEKCSDVGEGTSKANSGIVHAGFDNEPGSVMAKMNVEGNAMMEQLSKDLDFEFKRNGSLVLCFDKNDEHKLNDLLERGKKNGVPGLEILTGSQVRVLEPKVSDKVTAALYAPTGGIVCPFGLTEALAENAADNGVQFKLNTAVKNIVRKEDCYEITAENCGKQVNLTAKIVINCAGVYADSFHNMVSSNKMTIIPRKGEYCLMDKKVGNTVSHTIFQLPTEYGKGVLVTPTVHGNLLTGPTATDIEDKEGVNTTADGMNELLTKAKLSVPDLPVRQVITSFSGLRAHRPEHDFVIEQPEDAPGFIDVAGMESPGLSSAPAVGKYVAELAGKIMPAEEKEDFIATRKGVPSMANATNEERQKLIDSDPSFANVICRCETVTEGEILNSIHRTLGARTLDAVKRRTRAGMGRCQSGFCNPRVVEILARELGVDEGEITKKGHGSEFISGYDKEDL